MDPPSSKKTAIAEAASLMAAFADRSGLSSASPPQRYLWTDAFAVCNFLELARATGEQRHTELALRLVDQVHRVLGRHRPDDSRSGWLSGLGEEEGARHPTRGGLRIGKPLSERRSGEPFDERLEWNRDGQYFHYLTKWMHALDQVSRATRQPCFNLWARELAVVAHGAFSHGGPGSRRMVWKMSTDLSRPLVPSMGQHDALDGFVTCAQLEWTAKELHHESEAPRLTEIAADFGSMVAEQDLATTDPLGLGGLLMDAGRGAQLVKRGAFPDGRLLDALWVVALEGLAHYVRQGDLRQPAGRRLAFRELGLAIGLHAPSFLATGSAGEPLGGGDSTTRMRLDALRALLPLGAAIESFWLAPEHRQSRTWAEHRDINDVMLATSLVPDGVLALTTVR